MIPDVGRWNIGAGLVRKKARSVETSADVVPFPVVRRVLAPSGFGGLPVRACVAGLDLRVELTMNTLYECVALAVSFTAGLLAAQSPAPQAVSAVDRIVLLPVVDSRATKMPKINLEKLRKHAQKGLQRKGYAVVLSGGAPSGTWTMTVTLDDIGSQGFNPTARVSGRLYDNPGRVIWEGTGSGAYHSANEQPAPGVYRPQDQMQLATAGVLTDLLFHSAGWARGEALDSAVLDLLKAMPSRPQPKQKMKTPKK
ncbi:MAG: hypothetical protein ACLQOO_13175 [Terriglobia bacterium]